MRQKKKNRNKTSLCLIGALMKINDKFFTAVKPFFIFYLYI